LTLLFALLAAGVHAAEAPRVVLVNPPTLVSQKKTVLTIRGVGLDQVDGVQLSTAQVVPVKIQSKGKSAPPAMIDPKKAGDTEIKAEVELPRETPPGSITLVVKGAAGTSDPYELLVVEEAKLVLDREPNRGFEEAQAVSPGQTIQGEIHEPRDVDVYRFSGTKGQKLSLKIEAQRMGSALDGLLTLYSGGHQLLAGSDDEVSSRDPTIEITLPSDGEYFLVVKDANDSGSKLHFYRLLIQPGEKK
jgi:hypothetical protein